MDKNNIRFVDWTFKNRYYYLIVLLWTLITEYQQAVFIEIIAVAIARAIMLLLPFYITYKCYKSGYAEGKSNDN